MDFATMFAICGANMASPGVANDTVYIHVSPIRRQRRKNGEFRGEWGKTHPRRVGAPLGCPILRRCPPHLQRHPPILLVAMVAK